ncbi:unnamed protein product [Ectocarpus sp. CCAP 1310/34]|nr:unnamed protein product [Ectocarpus sp. CCAP 1310/34]
MCCPAAFLQFPTAAHYAGKSCNSIGILSAPQQSRFKRQRLAGSDATRAQCATQQHVFTSRQQRSMRRRWRRRETKLRKAFDKQRGAYLTGRVQDLTENIRVNKKNMRRLGTALATNQVASLLVPVPPSPVEDGEDADDRMQAEAAGADLEVGG